MGSDWGELLGQIADRIVPMAREDASLRASLRLLAEKILAAIADPMDSPPLEQAASAIDCSPVAESPENYQCAAVLLPKLTLGMSPAEPAQVLSWPPRWQSVGDDDLAEIESRCRLKAEGARWSAERQRRLRESDYEQEIAPRDRDIIARAKSLPDCYLWMNAPHWQPPADWNLMDQLADTFEGLAETIKLVRGVVLNNLSEEGGVERALDLLAEAQSALRAAVMQVHDAADSDQVAVFAWLRNTVKARQVVIHRYMRVDDLASPHATEDLLTRLDALDSSIQQTRGRDKQRRRLLGKLRYELKKACELHAATDRHWATVARTVDELLETGMTVSNKEIRELLLPVVDEIPALEPTPHGFALVLGEIDRFIAGRVSLEEPRRRHTLTDDVLCVRQLLAGRQMVMIGGERRVDAEQQLIRAFELADLNWISTREHESIERFRAPIYRDEVVLVLQAIRWSSHSYGEVVQFCQEAGKLFVRLPAGYSPNQVARQILQQCGDRLAARHGKKSA